MEQQNPKFVAFEAIDYLDRDPTGASHPLLALQAKVNKNPDHLYWHQAIKQPDAAAFKESALKEVSDHTKNGLWRLVPKKKVQQGTLIAPGAGSMLRKRRINMREVYKWKARLAFDGSKKTNYVNNWETYSPVIQWPVVRFLLTHALINKWHFKQIDYVLAYTQAQPETDMYMAIPKGFRVDSITDEEFVLKINKNLYGQTQAGRVWSQHLVSKLKEAGLKQSRHEKCLFYYKSSVYVLYVDDSILMGPNQAELNEAISKLEATGLNLTHEDGLDDFLGVNIHHKDDGTIHLTQPHLIDEILKDLRLD